MTMAAKVVTAKVRRPPPINQTATSATTTPTTTPTTSRTALEPRRPSAAFNAMTAAMGAKSGSG